MVQHIQSVVTIFGSSRPQPGSKEYELARTLGRDLAAGGFAICNGAYGGTMEGVTCDLFSRPANEWITEEIRTSRLVERIVKLAETGSAYVVLPGGTGTLLELAFVLETVNKGFSVERPIVLLGSFWEPVLDPLKEEMKEEGLGNLARFLVMKQSPQEAIAYLKEALGKQY